MGVIRQRSNGNANLFERAYGFAAETLAKKDKEWGKNKLQHSLRAASILSEFGFDNATTIAAILHDAFIYNLATVQEIESGFGKDVAEILEEFAKMRSIEKRNFGKIDTGLLSKIILATAKDIRTIFVKIAARFDGLQNPMGLKEKELQENALVALKIYAPICHKLGLYELKSLLEDIGLKVLHPGIYQKIKKLVGKTKEQREALLQEAIAEFTELMRKEKKEVTIEGRVKDFYAIYKKMTGENKKPFNEIYDLLGIRIICKSIKECYEVLGVVHSSYALLPNKFTDYIANPKRNRYRSIHTVVEWKNRPLEVQIRTWEMHYENETGLAAHWEYKQCAKDKDFDKKLSWAKQLVEWQRKMKKEGGFINSLKMDFGKNRIFVFTPKGEVVVLPEGSTPIDFAFAIHSDLGNKCQRVKVNGKIVPLDYKLDNTDTIEVIPAKKPQVKRQWLTFVKSAKAQSKIRQKLGIKTTKKPKKKNRALTTASDKIARIARCCNPLPGDEIIGFRTTKRKITIHRKECKNVSGMNERGLLQVGWGLSKKDYSVEIKVNARDKPGVLPSILNVFENARVAINSTNAKVNPNSTATCTFNVKIKNLEQLEELIKRIRQLPAVFSVERS